MESKASSSLIIWGTTLKPVGLYIQVVQRETQRDKASGIRVLYRVALSKSRGVRTPLAVGKSGAAWRAKRLGSYLNLSNHVWCDW